MAGKRLTKSQVVSELAEMTELDKKSINKVFDGLTEIIKKQLGSRGPGEFVIPGLLKLLRCGTDGKFRQRLPHRFLGRFRFFTRRVVDVHAPHNALAGLLVLMLADYRLHRLHRAGHRLAFP